MTLAPVDTLLDQGQKVLISVVGPTASGKTALAIECSQRYQTQIVSNDSRQVYREMNVGVARPSLLELNAVPHHFIASHSIFQPFSVGDYAQQARQVLDKLFESHDVVVLVGGSGLYEKSLIEGLDEFPDVADAIAQKIQNEYAQYGLMHLQNQIKLLDSVYYHSADIQNPRRLMRALGVCLQSGKPYSAFLGRNGHFFPYKVVRISPAVDRLGLYESINRRVFQMLEQGLEQEAQSLYGHKYLRALQTVGYQEWFDYWDGLKYTNTDQVVSMIQQNTRRYAKRQLTWMKNNQSDTIFNL